MHIITSDFKKGFVKLRVTDPDDLWYLSHIIDPGDLVKSKTTRKIRIGDSENAKVTKKTLTLQMEAETVEFGENGNHLRINGRIREGPEDIPLDSYHAISIEEGSEFTLQKVSWLSYQKQKLTEASEKKYNYLICIFDREEALIALTQKQGYKVLVKIKGDVPKKTKTVEVKKDFQQEIIKAIDIYASRNKPESIILASPAFYKEDLMKKINSKELKEMIVLATCSDVSESSLDEVIKRPELATTLKNSRARQEKLLIDELLSEINKDNLAAYGWDEVEKAIEAGAVSKLLISDIYILETRRHGTYSIVDERMKQVDNLKGEIHIISGEFESGKRLNGLGGIAAILRYKLT